ncbi:RICIN domain-containing protein [Neisseria perflava]|uniref:RICIN domain-containing protein n=1 Tax=Neisseria perflava TaxID=33053 RepID=UPI0020A08C5B|nr:ricin-type beta-trefoil lectin domain protein [Neisseria perflava]MCP1660434.1 hypothetical protein [Neisseria perflava]MCP1772116.1 hypothetical protein [Neisseria perflava]
MPALPIYRAVLLAATALSLNACIYIRVPQMPSVSIYEVQSDNATLPQKQQVLLKTSDGLCLDNSASSYQGIIAYTCHGKANQRFDLSGDTIRVENKCLDVAAENGNSGAKIIPYACHGKSNQQWYAVGKTIRSRLNDKCLDSKKDGNRLTLQTCDGSSGQQFYPSTK